MSNLTTTPEGSDASRTVRRPYLRLGLIVLAVGALFASRFFTAVPPPTPSVATQGISPKAAQAPDILFSKVDGTVLKLDVSEGQSVKVGDLIAELDPTPFQKAVADAEAALTLAKSQTKQAVAAAPLSGTVGDPKAQAAAGPSGPIMGRISGNVADLSRFQTAVAAAEKQASAAQLALDAVQSNLTKKSSDLDAAKAALPQAQSQVGPAESDVKAASAAVEVATAKRTKAKAESDKFEMLYKDGVVSMREAEKVTAKFNTAVSAEAAANDQLQEATETLSQRKAAVADAEKLVAKLEGEVAAAKAAILPAQAKVVAATDLVKQANDKLQSARTSIRRVRGEGDEVMIALAQAGNAPVPVQIKPVPVQETQINVSKAQEALEVAKANLSSTKIYAATAGVIHLKGLAVGAKVAANKPVAEIAPN